MWLSPRTTLVDVTLLRRRRWLLLIGLLAACALLAGGCVGKDAVDQNGGNQFGYVSANEKGSLIAVSKRKQVGPVHGDLIDGGSYQLSSDKGHVVVLNFFASWCGPCQTETPQFDSVYRARKAAGVRFVGMDVKEASQSAARSWLTAKGVSFPVVYDPNGKTALQLGRVPLSALPSTVLVDKQGRVAAVYFGELLPADLEPVLSDLSNEA